MAEAWGTMRFAYMTLLANTPDIFFDNTACAFTYFVARILAGCHVVAFVHYPTISVVRPFQIPRGRLVTFVPLSSTLIDIMPFCFFPGRTCWQRHGIVDHPTTTIRP